MVAPCILEQHKKTASHAEFSIENCHRMHKSHKYTTSASYFPYRSTYSSTRHNTNRKHNIHHTPYTNIQTLRGSKNPLSLTTAATQQTFPKKTHNHYNRHKNNKRHIHTSIVSRNLATRGNPSPLCPLCNTHI